MWKPQFSPFRKHKKRVFQDVIKTLPFIYQIGETPLLRNKSQEVPFTEITSESFKQKINYLKSCIQKYRKLTGKGRGITAVQIGIPQRFSVVYMPEIKGELLIIINPKIIKQAKTLLQYPEICMSANPIIAPVVRPSWIEFDYYDEQGEKQLWKTKANDALGKMYNRVFQHEIDHMDGIINIDRVQSIELIFESDPTFYDRASFKEV